MPTVNDAGTSGWRNFPDFKRRIIDGERKGLEDDLAEALVGDIVPHDTRYTKEQTRAMEEVGVSQFC